jgi:hypothetical protein
MKPTRILFGTLAIATLEAQAIVMRDDFYDPSLTNLQKEVRYINLANQTRFDPVGQISFRLDDGSTTFGSAILVDENTILTAAHCIQNLSAGVDIGLDLSGLKITFGASSQNVTKTLRVTDYKIHPGWQGGVKVNGVMDLGNDLAVLQVYDAATTGGPVPGITPAPIYISPPMKQRTSSR